MLTRFPPFRSVIILLLVWILATSALPYAWSQTVSLEALGFSWRPEVDPFYELERTKLRGQYAGEVSPWQDYEQYLKLDNQTGWQEIPLTVWKQAEGPRPKVIRVTLTLLNTSSVLASNEIDVTLGVWTRMSPYQIDSKTLLVDYEKLFVAEKWTKQTPIKLRLPILAPEEQMVWYTDPIPLGAFLLGDLQQFPTQLMIKVFTHDPNLSFKQREQQLMMLPSHFPTD